MIRATVKTSDSGGPLIDLNGRVLGMVFASSADDPETGFVLTARDIAPQLANIGNTVPVATGLCIVWSRHNMRPSDALSRPVATMMTYNRI